EDLALGLENWASPAEFKGRRLNAWKLEEYKQFYPTTAEAPAAREVLWVGNSQLHAINQRRLGEDQVAAYYASQALDQPGVCLSRPKANLQERLVMLQWALTRRRPQWFILPLVFDKLRNDTLREGFENLASPELDARLRARPVGRRLADELAALNRAQTDA